jgi:hypothetical protein
MRRDADKAIARERVYGPGPTRGSRVLLARKGQLVDRAILDGCLGEPALGERPDDADPGEQVDGQGLPPAAVDVDDLDRDQLHALAKEMGLKLHPFTGAAKVRAAIVEARTSAG